MQGRDVILHLSTEGFCAQYCTSRNIVHNRVFCAREQFPHEARSRVATKRFFAEPCAVEVTPGAVMHMHQLFVYYRNKRIQSREIRFNVRKMRPSEDLFPFSAEFSLPRLGNLT